MIRHRSTRCARRCARRPVHSTCAPPPHTSPSLQSLLVRRVAAAQHATGPRVSVCMFAAGFCSNGAQKQAIIANKRKVEQQPRIMDARRRKAASSSEVCDECDLTDDRGARSLTACASVPVANASRTCFPTGQEPPVEVLQTLLAASDRAADARHPRDAKHGHESRTEHLEVATRFSSGLIFRLIRLHTVTKKCVHTVGPRSRFTVRETGRGDYTEKLLIFSWFPWPQKGARRGCAAPCARSST